MGLTRLRAEQISDIDYKQAVRVITITDITLSGGAPSQVDGVNLSVSDRVLVTAQDPGSENGIYQVETVGSGSNGTWIRSLDTNATGELEAGTIVMVTEGTVYADTQWKLTTNNPIIIGTTALTFEQNSAYAFGNIYANGTAVLANSVGSTVTFTAGNNIAITGNNTSKTVTIGVTGISLNSISNGTSNVNVVSSGGNVTVGVGGTANVAEFSTDGLRVTGLISATGNVTGGNLLTAGLISATGNITGGNVNTSALRSGAGALTISTGSGAINLQPAGGNIVLSADTYINNVAQPVQNQDAATKLYVDNAVSTAISYHQPVVAASTTTMATTTGGTITYSQPNGAANGVGALLTTTGSFNLIDTANVQTVGTRILVKNEANAVFNGVYTWANATNIVRATDADTYGAGNTLAFGINDYFFVSSGNVNLGSAYIVSAPAGTITFGTSNIVFSQFSQSQVYTANTAAGISLVGTVINAKVDGVTTAFDGGGNISVKPSANLTTPNIGAATGTSLSVTGNVTGGNLLTGGLFSATGNITGGNVLTGGLISAASTITSPANITGGNLLTGGLISTTGNITGGNLLTGGLISAASTITSAANVTGGNLLTGGLLTVAGNVIGGNLLTGGLISATGNISGNVFLGNGSQLTGINAFSNISVTSGNSVLADSISDTLFLTAGTGIAIMADSANDTITISTVATDSIFATGGDMGLVTETVTSSEDLGLVTDAATISYDLGSVVTAEGLIYPSQLVLPTYTVTELGNVSTTPAGQFVYCSNESGGAVPAFSDGTNWRRVTDRQIVS